MPLWDPIADLEPDQRERLREFGRLLVEVSRRVNLISPASARDVESRHLRHSLALSLRSFPDGSRVIDWGSGGGLPAVPLAIRFPRVRFVAVDSVGKKVDAIRLFARRLGLANLEGWAGRAEGFAGTADYSVSRATAPLADLWTWHARVAAGGVDGGGHTWRQGLICLKGGDLTDELRRLNLRHAGLSTERVQLEGLVRGEWTTGKEVVAVWRDLADGSDD